MSYSTRNSGKRWTPEDIKTLKQLVKGNTPTGEIGSEPGRTPEAVYSKAQELDLSVKPVNQSPYNRQNKPK